MGLVLVGVGRGPGLDDGTLLRWLRAEKYDVDKAYNRLVKHAQWRADYVPDGRIHEVLLPPLPLALSLAGHVLWHELARPVVHAGERRAKTCVRG